MAYQYTTHTWSTGEAITAEKMNHIENGIQGFNTASSSAESAVGEIERINNTLNNDHGPRIGTNEQAIEGLRTSLAENTGNGNTAYNEIIASITGVVDEETQQTYDHLVERLNAISQKARNAYTYGWAANQEILGAHQAGYVDDTLAKRFKRVEDYCDSVNGSVTGLDQTLKGAGGFDGSGQQQSLAQRLANIDNNEVPSRTLISIITEINNTHGVNNLYGSLTARFQAIEGQLSDALESTALNKTGINKYDSIDARFEAIESELTGTNSMNSRIDTLQENVTGLSENKIDTAAIANNLTTESSGKVLDARQGKILNDAKINYTDVVNDVTHTDIDKPLSANQGKVLKEAIDSINNGLNTADTGLVARVSALETSVDTTTTGLKDRMTTAEGDIDALEADLNTTTTGLKDRMTTAENDIDALESDLNTTSTGLKARVSTAENDIDALETALGDASSGLTQRVGTLETTVGNSSAGLVKRVTDAESAISHVASGGDPGGLTQRVTALEGKDTIIVDYDGEHSNYTEEVPNISSPSENADYLIADDEGKYFYWRYFGAVTGWQLVGGAGGSGNGSSSGEFVASLEAITTPDENVDYFVGNSTNGYVHYRYIPPETEQGQGMFVSILPKGILANASVNSNGKPVITTLEDSNVNVLSSFNALKTVNCTTTYDTDGVTPKSYSLSFTDINGQEYTWDLAAGGGGSSYTVQFINENGNLELYVPNNATAASISARIYARLGTELLSQDGTITVKYKAEAASDYTTAQVITGVANNVVTNIDIIGLIPENSITNIQLTASIQPEDTPITRNITYTIHRVPMSIEAYNYNPASIKTANFNFQYYCIGSNLAKIVHFVIDGVDTTEDVGTPANTDLLTKQISVSGLTRGMHSLKVYFTVGSFHSNEINTYFLYDNNTEANKPMIALATNKSTIQDGDPLNLYYTVYTKGLQRTESVTLETYTLIDNVRTTYETKSYTNVDNGIENIIAITNYPSSGTFYMTMTATHTVDETDYTDSKTISMTITEYQSAYDSQMRYAGVENTIYQYNASGRTNNDSDKAAYHHTFTSVSGAQKVFTATNTGFNWASNGYKNGDSLIISGGATHSIDVPLFTSSSGAVSLETDTSNDDILKNGRTFEIDYEVTTATNLNAEIASFGNGLKITPSVSYLVPQGTTVTVNSHGLIEKEDEICAAYLTTGKRMHMVFVIEPKATEPTSQGEYHQCVNIYINGEFVNSCPYALSDNFTTNSTFTMGSDTCIIKLYSVRMYNRGLTNDEVLKNYMMAPITKIAKINRFAENDILDNNKLVSYEKARNKFNCLLITGEISPYKKSTKTPSGVTLTKPDFENLSYTTEFNLLDKKANGTYYSSNNVQGTSSQTYPIHNLKVYLAEEEITTDPDTGDEVATSKKYKYSLKGSDGIAESTLCWKADYMSTDHANTLNANFANDLFTDKLPSQIIEPKVQNTVYGIRCLLFQRDDEQSTPVFIADGCLNNDKGNNSAFGLSIKNESISDTTRQKWEFTNNSSALDFFQADGLLAQSNGDFYAKTAFESTYPDEGDLEDDGLQPNYNHLQILMTWVHQRANYWDASTTEGTGGTYNDTSYSTERELKKAIFINEFQQHFNLNHILTYHLFSEFIALCDNRAKNMFLRCDNVKSEKVRKLSDSSFIFEGNSNPNASFFESTTNIGTNDDPIYAFTHADQIDWQSGEDHSTFAIWYPVLYDLDSCYGVENVGRITIPYDAEWTYAYNNKNQFSGVESRLWLMVEDSFGAELKALAQILYPNKLNYNTFYNTQIQAILDSVCPALTNQDMLLKFNAYWADGFIDYSLPNNPHVYRDYKYIQRGSRSYQKDTFIKLRSNYLSSKYVTSNFMNDQIRFRSSVIVPVSNSGITVTTNQTLYPAITYGDNKEAIRSVNKINPGDSVTLYASDQVGNTDTIHIGGASALTDIGDISKFEPYNLDVSGGVNLKSLVVGSNVVNASTNKIDGLGSCALLETINVRNCTNFSGTLNLSGNGLIKNVYASGSGITNIELHEGGNLTNIEYGAATATIKIVNHGGLQSFTYENAQNNHYANVTRLHIENTPNVPIVDIITNALSHLTAGVRLVGINLNLVDDPTFLQMITSDLAKGKYLNSAGVFVPSANQYPYISGAITIATIRSSLLAALNEHYPDLVINVGQVDRENEVRYEDDDGTLLFTYYGISSDSVIDPVSDTNLITGSSYIEMPTKESDAQYHYRFGEYTDQDEYVRFSGWVLKNTTTHPTEGDHITSTLTYVAYYPTRETRQYTVKWFAERNPNEEPLLSYTRNYNTNIGSYVHPESTAGFIRAKQNGNTIKVFKGWSRPVSRLTSDINIYAQWETSNINDDISDITMSDLTAADVYALANQVTAARKDVLLRDGDARAQGDRLGEPIMIRMGQDYNYEEGATVTDLVGSQEQLVLRGTKAGAFIYDSIRPLALNQDWTLALDYKFLMSNATALGRSKEFVLASCYRNANSSIQGFKVSLLRGSSNPESNIKEVQVSWGSTTQTVDYVNIRLDATDDRMYCQSYRNMLVLAHNAAEPNNLYIYCTPAVSNSTLAGSDYSTGVVNYTLTWNNNENIDTPLILGGNFSGEYSGTDTNQIEADSITRYPAQGIIYWAKYWNADLGSNTCLDLAAWPHETVPFYLSGYNGANGQVESIYKDETIPFVSNLSFVAAQGIGDRYFYSFKTGTLDANGNAGWPTSKLRTICNNLIYKGMPTAYKSIIRSSTIASAVCRSSGSMNVTADNVRTQDYLFLPSQTEVTSSSVSIGSEEKAEVNAEWHPTRPWHWMRPATLENVYQVGTGQNQVEKTTLSDIRYFLYRFRGNYMKPDAKIFLMNSDPAANDWSYNSTNGTIDITVQPGDIWANTSTATPVAYMYVSNTQISKGQWLHPVNDILSTNGAWIRCDIWQLRTYNVTYTGGSASEQQFRRVHYDGGITIKPTQNNNLEDGRLLCPEFTV